MGTAKNRNHMGRIITLLQPFGTAENKNHMGRIITLRQPWGQLKIDIIYDKLNIIIQPNIIEMTNRGILLAKEVTWAGEKSSCLPPDVILLHRL